MESKEEQELSLGSRGKINFSKDSHERRGRGSSSESLCGVFPQNTPYALLSRNE